MRFDQIHRQYFKSCQAQSVSNRLKKLSDDGLIAKHQVGIFIFKGRSHKVGVVFSIKGKGLALLRRKYPNLKFRDAPLPVHSVNLVHDLLLNDVVTTLQCRWPNETWTNGKYLSAGGSKYGARVPDAIFQNANSRGVKAIELELTTKSETRYRHIVLDYRLNAKFEKVLFICANATIFQKIAAVVTGDRYFKMAASAAPLSVGKFEVLQLTPLLGPVDLKNDSLSLKITEVTL